ncbi:MAG: BPSS1780 family membrane protein [Alcanivoracaceae bacterium]|nr:BPSS1780 family membrane protein [Alcanivoracaceae bacterium]
MSEFNPYQQPQSQIVTEKALDDLVLHAPVRRGIGNGFRWLSDAWGIFVKNPGLWIGGVFLLWLVGVAAGSIPFLGIIIGVVINPLIYAGVYIMARNSDYGLSLRFEDFFAGFQSRVGTLIALGIVSFGGMLAVLAVSGLLFWGVLGSESSQLLQSITDMEAGKMPDAAALNMFVSVMSIALVAVVLFFLYAATVWFAVPLIALDENMTIGRALKWSFMGCFKNAIPMTLYSILMMLILVAAMVPLLLGLLIAMPLIFISIYTSFHDIYVRP